MEPINSSNGGADEILVEQHSHAKIVLLNRPQKLNALSFQMISRLLELFLACEGDCSYKLIILKVSILNGTVMGSGAGASVHGRFRIATEKSVFAMPETVLGFFPDVGGSYFLSRLPGFFGEYLGLTGTRLDGAEMLACGLATHFVPEERLSLLEEALCNANSSDSAIISAIIDEFSQHPRLKEKSVYHLVTGLYCWIRIRTQSGNLLNWS